MNEPNHCVVTATQRSCRGTTQSKYRGIIHSLFCLYSTLATYNKFNRCLWSFIITQRQESTVGKSNTFIHPPARLQYMPQTFE